MKNSNTKNSKHGQLSFYAVLALCSAMIGVSCWFAYTQTTEDLNQQLESALDSAQDLAGLERIEVPVQTEAAMTTAQEAAVPLYKETKAVHTTSETVVQTTKTETAATANAAAVPPCLPMEGEILTAFSKGELVKSATTGVWQTHNGVDIACTLGDEVRAAAAGTVEAVEDDPLWGVTVTIDHGDGTVSRYCSLNTGLTVNIGDTVTAGMVIGAVGDTADIESGIPTH